MKYVIVIPDGVADEPQSALGGRTPLQAARTPHADDLARSGVVGRANHTPLHLPAGSDVANLSLLGFDPVRYFTGRAPIEAAAQGLVLGDDDWVLRCNLVTIRDQVMHSFTAGQISSDEARQLLDTAQTRIGDRWPIRFYPGVSYRNLAVWRGSPAAVAPFSRDTRTTPPHDLTDQPVTNDFPRGPGSTLLSEWMGASVEWFHDHPVNRDRESRGLPPATNLWLWGLGRKPELPAFATQFPGIRGAMITAVDLLRGLANLIGWQNIHVPGATGYLDTDYAGKGRAAIAALQDHDLVVVHVEATDEASHEGLVDQKIAAMESIDREIIGPVLQHLRQAHPDWRMMVLPDHPTLLRTRTHTHGDVPVVAAGSGIAADSSSSWDEPTAGQSGLTFDQGWKLMPWFLGSNDSGSGRSGSGRSGST